MSDAEQVERVASAILSAVLPYLRQAHGRQDHLNVLLATIEAAAVLAAGIPAIQRADVVDGLCEGLRERVEAHAGAAADVISDEACPGHVASTSDPKICGRCGVHIDSLRPPDEDEPG